MTTYDFPSLGVSESVVRALEARGIMSPFPVQTLVLPDASAGRDVMAKSRTGSGKTLAFAIPIVERLTRDAKAHPQALILVPTRELAAQVVEEFEDVARAKGLHVAAAYGGGTLQGPRRGVAKADILWAAAGRVAGLDQRRQGEL